MRPASLMPYAPTYFFSAGYIDLGVPVGSGTRAEPVTSAAITRSMPIARPHVPLPRPAPAADKPLAPFRHGHLGAVALGHLGGVGLDLMAAFEAPHDEPHASYSAALPSVIGGPQGSAAMARRRCSSTRARCSSSVKSNVIVASVVWFNCSTPGRR